MIQDRNNIKRHMRINVYDTLREFNKKRGREEEYVEYRTKYDDITCNLSTDMAEIPLEIVLEVNNYCNLKCKMCSRNYMTIDEKRDISPELLDKILLQAKEIGVPAILVGAGAEATTASDFLEIVSKVGDTGFLDFWLITNGTRLTEELSNALLDAQINTLVVSVDAATKETYKIIRGGDFENVEQNIRRFIDIRNKRGLQVPIVKLSFCVQDDNRHEKAQFLEKWENIADIVDFQTYIDPNPNKEIKPKGNGKKYLCRTPLQRLLISCDGKISPCCCGNYYTDRPIYLGKDFETIQDYWQSDWHKDFCKSVITENYCECCAKCVESFNFEE